MWDNLLRVDWGRLTHAYGRARDVPKVLLDMVSADEATRAAGWNTFGGSVNHQGDFYDSTVAAIPFLVEAASRPEVPGRETILDYFRTRWLDAPDYGGDPALAEPPGGVDEPTPTLTDAELAEAARRPRVGPDDDDEEFDVDSCRRMELCAWQAGRAIAAGRPVFERLLEDGDRDVAAASAALLLLWPETRGVGKRALIRLIDGEPEPLRQGRRILEFGVYAADEDAPTFERWVAPSRPAEVRAAAALAWAWAADPGPLPGPAARALGDASVVDSDAFARLPREGIWRGGPLTLPSNAAGLILRLAGHRDPQLRWRAVQGLAVGSETAKHLPAGRVVPVLVERLSDRDRRVRETAAFALSQRGEPVVEIAPDVVATLIRALDDDAPSVCGHAARWLAAMSHRLPAARRAEAADGIDRAAGRFEGQSTGFVCFESMWIPASPFLRKQHRHLLAPGDRGVSDLLAALAFPDRPDAPISPAECDRELAEAYARHPRQTTAAAIELVLDAGDRDAAIGAANWLATLGPAAEPALGALDAMAGGDLDPFAQGVARTASDFIRRSLLVEPDADERAAPSPGAASARVRIARLARATREGRGPGAPGPDLVPGLIDDLADPDAYVRARSAELLGEVAPSVPSASGAVPALETLLVDEDAAEVGIAGRFELEGRLYHWRRVRRSPRAEAIRALFRMGRVAEGDRMLRAMVAESAHAPVVCGVNAATQQFGIDQWRSAVAAAGGLALADPVIRAARQRCRERAWSGTGADLWAFAAATELAEVIRRLSGRLV